MNPYMPDKSVSEVTAEIGRLIRETRKLVESSFIPRNGAIMCVMLSTFILSGKENGMSWENFIEAFRNVWNSEGN